MGSFLEGILERHALVLKFVVAFLLLVVFLGASYNYASGKRSALLAKERELSEFR